MRSYHNDATLIADAESIPGTASLNADESGDFTDWGGTFEADDPHEDFHAVMNTEPVKLRLANGQERDVVPTYTSVGSGQVRISGNGPIPF